MKNTQADEAISTWAKGVAAFMGKRRPIIVRQQDRTQEDWFVLVPRA